MQTASNGKRLLVLGGGGFVGREVCRNAIDKGYQVTSLTRRGENPNTNDDRLNQVDWQKGDATDKATVSRLVNEADAVVHAVGLLFDVNSGLQNLNTIVSGSGSLPGDDSTYDRITRLTALNLIEAVEGKNFIASLVGQSKMPFVFVSAAEAGWPDVTLGDKVEKLAPEWLTEYLVAKRAVEAKLTSSNALRPIILRPSLIWNWRKFDVLPVIPVFNLASALGVPFVDKTVRVETLAKAAVAGLEDPSVSGVQRFDSMEKLAEQL
jgi:nucleoside-diphosphate-sugar epimerase